MGSKNDSTASVSNSGEKHLGDDFKCSKLEDKVGDFVRCGNLDCAISLLEFSIQTLKNNISSSSSQIRLLTSVKSIIEEGYSRRGGALMTDQSSCRSIIRRIREAEGRELNVDEATQPPVLDFSKITLDEDEGPATEEEEEEEDWEKIADQDALPVLDGMASESTSGHCVVDGPVETKRRGRGSFLYKKAQLTGLYSDGVDDDVIGSSCCRDFEQDQEEEYERRSRHSTEPTSVEGTTIDHRNLARFSLNDTKTTLPQEARPRPETSARVANRLISQAMGIKPSTEFGYEDLKRQEEARKDRILMRLRQKTEAWGPDDSTREMNNDPSIRGEQQVNGS